MNDEQLKSITDRLDRLVRLIERAVPASAQATTIERWMIGQRRSGVCAIGM